jgi:hypothetical protein
MHLPSREFSTATLTDAMPGVKQEPLADDTDDDEAMLAEINRLKDSMYYKYMLG